MLPETNHLGQPVGFSVAGWRPPPFPPHSILQGQQCRLAPLDPQLHAADLYAANAHDREGRSWTYLPYGPFDGLDSYRAWMERYCGGPDPLFYVILDQVGTKALGVASYLRVDTVNGTLEVGHLNFSPLLQRTIAATEAMYLMMAHAFELGYRRYEWKCDALNGPSRSAAQRLGFSFEGIFRHAAIIKGRNRDTAWYAVIKEDWPALQKAFLQWLDPANFDASGRQRIRLSQLTGPVYKAQAT